MAKGDEILIVDGNARDREGMKTLFEEDGYVVTTAGDPAAVQDLVTRKFFPAAVVELDTGGPANGLNLMRLIHKYSKPTSVVLLASRRSFEAAVDAFREGVTDVVIKRPEEVPQLRRALARAADRYRATDKDSDLLREVQGVLEDAVRTMVEMGRQVYREASDSMLERRPRVLLVDGEQAFLQELGKALATPEWEVVEVAVEMSGGGALDKSSEYGFDLVLARDHLMDLPGHMVVKTIQSHRPETLAVVYTAPGAEGHIDRYEDGHVGDVERPFRGAEHLVERLRSMVEELSNTRRERRYIKAFRRHHGAFLKRYAELKLRIDSLVG